MQNLHILYLYTFALFWKLLHGPNDHRAGERASPKGSIFASRRSALPSSRMRASQPPISTAPHYCVSPAPAAHWRQHASQAETSTCRKKYFSQKPRSLVCFDAQQCNRKSVEAAGTLEGGGGITEAHTGAKDQDRDRKWSTLQTQYACWDSFT